MEFDKYMHIERFGTEEVEGIESGECWVFPKIDGTNGSVWLGEDGTLRAGSRTRELTLDKDNAGFLAAMLKHDGVIRFLMTNPGYRLYGEWLVPHAIKTYEDDAWRKFYVFDVYRDADGRYMPFESYKPALNAFGIDYIPPLGVIHDGSREQFEFFLDNSYLIKEGKGAGEGIVIKNYNYKNKYGRTTWAKIVASEFKQTKKVKQPVDPQQIELQIVDKFVTQALIEKEYEKIRLDNDGWKSSLIPQLLSRVYYALINEEMWHILKDFKNPKIDFRVLNSMCTAKVKKVMGW